MHVRDFGLKQLLAPLEYYIFFSGQIHLFFISKRKKFVLAPDNLFYSSISFPFKNKFLRRYLFSYLNCLKIIKLNHLIFKKCKQRIFPLFSVFLFTSFI